MTNDQTKHMVDRFLSWKLPENFNPDGGVSFTPTFNNGTPSGGRHEPSGTNLLDYTQAEAMVRHMLEGLPMTDTPNDAENFGRIMEGLAEMVANAKGEAMGDRLELAQTLETMADSWGWHVERHKPVVANPHVVGFLQAAAAHLRDGAPPIQTDTPNFEARITAAETEIANLLMKPWQHAVDDDMYMSVRTPKAIFAALDAIEAACALARDYARRAEAE